jgi:hypothetical protein
MSAWISGNAVNNAFNDCLKPSLPCPIEGFSLAKYFSIADKSCLLNISSTNVLIISFWLGIEEDIYHLYVLIMNLLVITIGKVWLHQIRSD